MKKKDFVIVLGVVALVVLLLAGVQVMNKRSKPPNAGVLPTPAAEESGPPAGQEPTAVPSGQAAPSAAPTLVPAQAYLRIQVYNRVYEPLPLLDDQDIELTQKNGMKNVVRVTKDSIMMLSSTCENQNCVHQGVVSLENRDERILQNMIICLPNQVMLELLNAEEAQADWAAIYETNHQ